MRVVSRISVLALAALVAIPFSPFGAADEDPIAEVTHHKVTSFDGIEIAITAFRPTAASDTDPVPLVLHSHGWGGSRAKTIGGSVQNMLEDGYGVVSFDARGHGESGGLATVQHVDHEVKDLIALVDWIYDELGWVQKETTSGIPKDIVAGAIGGSYGGGYQLQLATYDGRLDALVPQMTWNDLRYSLAPNGVVKSSWVDALYGVGKAQARISPDIDRWWFEATTTNRMPQEAFDHFIGSSPDPSVITAPTLFVQGVPDVLFNMNEAVANYEGLLASGVESALVTYLGGHVLPGVQPVGFVGPARSGEPCGQYDDLALAWFDKHLRGTATADVPTGVSFALEDGTCVRVDALSDLGVRVKELGPLPVPNGGGSLLVPLDFTAGTLAGIPHLSATYVGAGDHIVFFSLVVVDDAGRSRIVDDQTTPLRLSGGIEGTTIDLDLTGVATHLDAWDRLFLRIDGWNEWYFSAGARTPAAGLLDDVVLELPYTDGPLAFPCSFPPSPSAPPECYV